MMEHSVTFEGLSLPVTSLDRSIRFYESLGFGLRFGMVGLRCCGTGRGRSASWRLAAPPTSKVASHLGYGRSYRSS